MNIEFKIANHGAELQSLLLDGREYLWHGDPKYWGRRSPILFPMVGKVFGGAFRVDGKEYSMGQHGFARDSEFVREGERYVLKGCPLEKYPYRFKLSVRYRAEGRRFYAEWEVLNVDDKDIHFQLGAHPALMLPDYHEEDPIHGYLQCFDASGKVVKQPMLSHGLSEGYLTELPAPVPMPVDADGLLPITAETFAIDTFMLENGSVKSVTMLDKQKRPYLSVGSDQTEAYGIWAPHKPGCPFVCLEPWCGITDLVGFSGELSERYLNHRLQPGEKLKFTYWIEIA
ncbi:MAG: aldose 1-epimerase family protein [Bacteroidales bacterium]|nr:aldose 1-epimerase family protein [Bacteroidales bacterium]